MIAHAASPEFVQLIDREFARRHLILSRGRAGGVEHLSVASTTNPAAVLNVRTRLAVPIQTSVHESESIARAIDAAYAARDPSSQPLSVMGEPADTDADIAELVALADRDLLSTSGKGPVMRLVDSLLFEAIGRGASDVHIHPLDDTVLVRCRVDGLLHDLRELPPKLGPPIVSRIKVMGRMDIAERRVPQDGRATVTIGAGETARVVDLRVSTLPTSHGERAVLRLLEAGGERGLQSFDRLGMPTDVETRFKERAGRSNGIVLVTGPTGSGKTTTLYATLQWIAGSGDGGRGRELNLMTIEDPIEYELSGPGVAISQAQVNTKKGVTFASGLRHILRQDPDVIMVGEIRDADTARIAIQASLTGHLVFSTLHTNDAAGAVTRLVDLGVEPYLVSASLSAVLAQRLVRTVHQTCGGAGCDTCFDSGCLGRTGIFELLTVTDDMRELIACGSTASAIRRSARCGGMRTLHEEADRLVREGRTTRLEAERVAHGFETP